MSWRGSPSHSMAIVVTGSSGAFSGSPRKRTRNFSCSNLTGFPLARERADCTLFIRPPRAAVSPGQKCTCRHRARSGGDRGGADEVKEGGRDVLVLRRLLHVVDYIRFHRRLSRFQFQTEFLKYLEKREARRIGHGYVFRGLFAARTRRSGTHRRPPLRVELVETPQSRLVDYRTIRPVLDDRHHIRHVGCLGMEPSSHPTLNDVAWDIVGCRWCFTTILLLEFGLLKLGPVLSNHQDIGGEFLRF